MAILNIPFSHKFEEIFFKFLLNHCDNANKSNSQFKKIIILSPGKVFNKNIINNIKFLKNLKQQNIFLKVIAYNEIADNIDLFIPKRPSNSEKQSFNNISESEALLLIKEAIKFHSIPVAESIFNLQNNIALIYNLYRAISEYYHYKIKKENLAKGNINENFLFHIINYIENKLAKKTGIFNQHKLVLASQLIQNATQINCDIIGILPTIRIPYINELLSSLYLNKKININIIVRGLDKNLNQIIWDNITPEHPQHHIKEFLYDVNIARSEVINLAQVEYNEDTIAKVFYPYHYLSEWNKTEIKSQLTNKIKVIEYPNAITEINEICKITAERAINNTNYKIGIISSNTNICNTIYTQLSLQLSKHNNLNIISNYIPYCLADKLEIKLFLMILNYCMEKNPSISGLLEILKHPQSCLQKTFYKSLNWFELNYLRSYKNSKIFFHKLLKLAKEKLEYSIDISSISNFKEKLLEEFLEKKSFLERLDIIYSKLEKFKFYLQNNHDIELTIALHLKLWLIIIGETAEVEIFESKIKINHSNTVYENDNSKINERYITQLLALLNSLLSYQFDNEYITNDSTKNFFKNSEYSETLKILLYQKCHYASDSMSDKPITISTPIEARFQNFDLIIICSLQENNFPKVQYDHNYISKFTREESKEYPSFIKARSIDYEIGYCAFDFNSLLFAGKEVILSYSYNSSNGSINIPSRWLSLLLLFYKSNGVNLLTKHNIATKSCDNRIEEKSSYPITLAPTPSFDHRPKKLSISAIEKLLQNPYCYYAELILKLKPIAKLNDSDSFQYEFAILVNEIISFLIKNESLNKDYINYEKDFLYIQENVLNDLSLKHEAISKIWKQRLKRICQWLFEYEQKNRLENIISNSKLKHILKIPIDYDGNQIDIIVEGEIGRVDLGINNNLALITDYRISQLPSNKDLLSEKKPKLAIKVLLLGKALNQDVIEARHIQINGKQQIANEKSIVFPISSIEKELHRLIEIFYKDLSPYKPSDNFHHKSYKHLARIKDVL